MPWLQHSHVLAMACLRPNSFFRATVCPALALETQLSYGLAMAKAFLKDHGLEGRGFLNNMPQPAPTVRRLTDE